MSDSRKFLLRAIESGLENGLLTPEDLFDRVTPEILAHLLPVDVKAKLLEACLGSGDVTEELILEVLGLELLAAHAPVRLMWRAVADAMHRSLGSGAQVAQPVEPAVPDAPEAIEVAPEVHPADLVTQAGADVTAPSGGPFSEPVTDRAEFDAAVDELVASEDGEEEDGEEVIEEVEVEEYGVETAVGASAHVDEVVSGRQEWDLEETKPGA